MNNWQVKPSYKFDLACFCNLFTGQEIYIKNHPNAYSKLNKLLTGGSAIKYIAAMINSLGFILSTVIISIYDSISYNGEDINELDNARDLKILHEYFMKFKLLTKEQWEQYGHMLPGILDAIKPLHEEFYDYWKKECLPEIEKCCEQYADELRNFPVLREVNNILGEKYKRQGDIITLYLCKFSAPHGTSISNQAFISDIRWGVDTTVSIALHEMMHPPFDRDKIIKISDELSEDEFICKARKLLPPYFYPTAGSFLEENIVEGAHIFLAEKLGVIKEPLKYFIGHDSGTHVISVLIYDILKRGVYKEYNLEEVINGMLVNGELMPGKIRKSYMDIYRQAGLLELIGDKFD